MVILYKTQYDKDFEEIKKLDICAERYGWYPIQPYCIGPELIRIVHYPENNSLWIEETKNNIIESYYIKDFVRLFVRKKD